MRLRTKATLLAVAALVSVVALANPVSASEETVGSCLAEKLLEAEAESGMTLHELEEAALADEEVAAAEFEKLEEDLEKCNESPNPILPATNEVIWGTLSFAVLFGLMWWKAFPAVKQGMDARSERIRADLAEADKTKADAAAIAADYESRLAEAKTESARIIEEARAAADDVRTDLIARAETEAADLRARADAEVDAMRIQAIADLQSEVSDIAIGAAERVVGSSLDRAVQTQLVEAYIQELTGQ